MELSYQKILPQKIKYTDQILFFIATVSLLIGYIDISQQYAGWIIVLPIAGFVIAVMNILAILFYNKVKEWLGDYFEINVFRLNGLILLVTAFGYQFEGRYTVQYVFYILAFFYFIIVPRITIQNKKRMAIEINCHGYKDYSKTTKQVQTDWQEVKEIEYKNNMLTITKHVKSKPQKYFLVFKDKSHLQELKNIINSIEASRIKISINE